MISCAQQTNSAALTTHLLTPSTASPFKSCSPLLPATGGCSVIWSTFCRAVHNAVHCLVGDKLHCLTLSVQAAAASCATVVLSLTAVCLLLADVWYLVCGEPHSGRVSLVGHTIQCTPSLSLLHAAQEDWAAQV